VFSARYKLKLYIQFLENGPCRAEIYRSTYKPTWLTLDAMYFIFGSVF